MLLVAAVAALMTACSANESGPVVTPPSWKGFNYVVKKTVEGKDEPVQIERGDISPGDEIKVYAVRKNVGKHIGKISGTIFVRYTAYMETGAPQTATLDKSAISVENASYDGWEDPYATFTLPELDGECEYYKVEVACQLYFKAFGNQASEVDYSDRESHVEPYIGNISTDLTKFDPMNGGSANSGVDTDVMQYYTLYNSNK